MQNIIHISDFHFSGEPDQKVADSARASAGPILSLIEELKTKSVIDDTAVVFASGDLIQSGSSNGANVNNDLVALERRLLTPLCKLLSIDQERVFIVPGNHELDRSSVEDSAYLRATEIARITEHQLKEDLRSKLGSYFDWIGTNRYISVDHDSPRLVIKDLGGQKVALFNSLAGCYSRGGAGDKGELFVLPSEIAQMEIEIPEQSFFVMHHPLAWFDDRSAERLKALFAQKRMRVFSGHIHSVGLEHIETTNGSFVNVQAGVGAETGNHNEIAVAWGPSSHAIAVRHFRFDANRARFEFTEPKQTKVKPDSAKSYFSNTAAFFDPDLIDVARSQAALEDSSELETLTGIGTEKFVTPDLVFYPEDQFSEKRVSLETLLADKHNIVLSGEELSGKTAFITNACYQLNSGDYGNRLGLRIDFRSATKSNDFLSLTIRALQTVGLSKKDADHVVRTGQIVLFIDNFDPDNQVTTRAFTTFVEQYSRLRWLAVMRGGRRFTPSGAPAQFQVQNVAYYGLAEIALPTVMKLIEKHDSYDRVDSSHAVVERVFRSINNLRAPRTIFYVNSLVDMFIRDGAVEPLNRYLLIENLISDRLRDSHYQEFPGSAIDVVMIETFVGNLAHYMLTNNLPYLSKAEYYRIAEEFIERKALPRKQFEPETMLKVLTSAFILREYTDGIAFMMLSVEDYFLAKHMKSNKAFRDQVISVDGLMFLSNVAEYYVAQNPNDMGLIEEVLTILDGFAEDVEPVLAELEDLGAKAIQEARPGQGTDIQDELVSELAEHTSRDGNDIVVTSAPEEFGATKRLRFAAEDRGAVFLQLGASILGVTRTMDQQDRIQIFERVKRILLISVQGVPLIAKHLADGHEVIVRGVAIKAEYQGSLRNQEDRFYIILRGMLFSIYSTFGTWAGSPSFFRTAQKLRLEEDNELVSAALFAQNIEADLAESVQSIPKVCDELESLIIREVVIRLYLNSMSLVPLPNAIENRAVDNIVNATIEMKPPKDGSNRALEQHKNALRTDFRKRLGASAFYGKLVKSRRSK
ncbi:MAG: metallophosphoesterase [Oceanicaulis sp.]|jgi:calcineurin-like phosphoesterase family protein|nr:metallophosphoesterase [Oceanicaulis sp.]